MSDPQTQFIDFRCPFCQKEVSFPAEQAGSVQQCLWCSQDFVVPQGSKEPAHQIRLNIRTPRLLLRRLNDKDRNDLLEIVSDGDSLRYLDWRTMNGEDVEEWLVEGTKFRLVNPGFDAYFGAELEQSSKLIAVISFDYYNEEYRHAGFAIVVNRAFRNQGYGTETVRGVLDFAFEEMNLHRVASICDSRNASGLKMLEKSGMRREGKFIESRKVKDEWISPVHYAMLFREWRR
jgi:ribosomal-protein-alanine N-acetyltransferase